MGKLGTGGIVRILAATVFVAVFVAPPALPAAAVEHGLMSFQGRLTDTSGNLLGGSSGTNYYFRFRIYDVATGGAAIWTSSGGSGAVAKVTQGVFNILLGDTSLTNMASLSSSLFDEAPRYLEVDVCPTVGCGTAETMAPRQRLGGALTARSVFGGVASVSEFRLSGLGDCDGTNDKIVYDATTSRFVCGTDNVGSGVLASDSLDWDEFVNSMTLDADTATALGFYTLSFGGLSLNGSSASVSGNLEIAGNVGIGTSPGTHQLEVAGGDGNIITATSAGIDIKDSSGLGGAITFGSGEAIIGVAQNGVISGWDSDGTLVFQQSQSAPDSVIDFVFLDQDGDWRFALPAPGPARGTYNSRSFIIAGPSTNVASAANCLYWGATNIDCNTSVTGADLFVQDDVEVLDNVFAEDFVASGSFSGVSASLSGNFELSGTVSSDLTPTLTNTFTLGTSALKWANVFATNASVSSLEVSGTASVSSLVINGSVFTPGSYLPLAGGTLTGQLNFTNASSSAGTLEAALVKATTLDSDTNNVLISANASVSSDLEVAGNASASATYGSGLTSCTGTANKLVWTGGAFSCASDQVGSPLGLEIIESGGTFGTHYGSISFETNAFNITFPTASSSLVKLDYTNGPASRSIAQTISGLWTFSGGASVSTRLEVSGTASISGTTTLRGLTYTWPSSIGSAGQFLQNNGSGALTWATAATGGGTKDISLVPEYPGAVLSSTSGSCTTCIGSMRSDNQLTSPYRNYYLWTTSQVASQTYDIWVKVVLPNDFSSLSSISIEGYRSSTNDRVYFVLFDSTNTQSSTTSGKGLSVATTNATWTLGTVAAPAGTYTAGQPVTFRIRMQAGQNQNVRAGTIRLEYTPL